MEKAHPNMEQGERVRLEVSKEQQCIRLRQEYTKTIETFSAKARDGEPSAREQKETLIGRSFDKLSALLVSEHTIPFQDLEKAILKLKLARYAQQTQTIDVNDLFDAIRETPKFLSTEKGSFHRLLEIHEQKTILAIAEARKRKSEQTGDTAFNPYESLFETKSGKFHLARLLNMPHLEEESDFLKHCVGTSDSYLNKMKRGTTEIFSLRQLGEFDPVTQTYGPDVPVVTIEYNVQTRIVEQIKKKSNKMIGPEVSYFEDLLDALRQLKLTRTDSGEPRAFCKISDTELALFPVPKANQLLTDEGIQSWDELIVASDRMILRVGPVEIQPTTPKEYLAKMLAVFHSISLPPESIARTKDEITSSTKAYVGPVSLGMFPELPETVEHIFLRLPEGRVMRHRVEIGGTSIETIERELAEGNHVITGNAPQMLQSDVFRQSLEQERETIGVVRLRPVDLGFPDNKACTFEELVVCAAQVGLEPCPPSLAVAYRLDYTDQPEEERVDIVTEPLPINDREVALFTVSKREGESRLVDRVVGVNRKNKKERKTNSDRLLLFRVAKQRTGSGLSVVK